MAELIVPVGLRERHRQGLARYLAGGDPIVLDQRIEIVAMRHDGSEFPCELTITRIAQPGDPVFVGYLRDITERHDAEVELRASRARIVAAADDARRRLERDLHDGAQQHLVGLALTLRLARRKLDDTELAAELLDEAIEDLATATGELRELARGLHPAVLTEGGLEPALVSIAKRATVPVTIEHAPEERLDPTVEITAYFVVAEALTNVARYAEAGRAYVSVRRVGASLVVEVRDDGRGGASMEGGSGLRGLAGPGQRARRHAVDRQPGRRGNRAAGGAAMRVVIAEDSLLLRRGAIRLLEDAGFEVVGEAGDADELLRLVRAERPDVAIVDIRMPPTHVDEGLQAARVIRTELPEVGVLMLSQYVEERYVTALLEHGAEGVGYLLKDRVAEIERFTDAIRQVAEGGSVLDPEVVAHMLGGRGNGGPLERLTEREGEVLQLMAEGKTNRAISQQLYMSERAVERHVTGIFTKLDLPVTDQDHRRVLAVLAYVKGA